MRYIVENFYIIDEGQVEGEVVLLAFSITWFNARRQSMVEGPARNSACSGGYFILFLNIMESYF